MGIMIIASSILAVMITFLCESLGLTVLQTISFLVLYTLPLSILMIIAENQEKNK